ncbi:MAG TPA: ATPase domain-containing protein, partial [Telluria sp.]
IVRNMGSIGIDLAHWVERDLLRFHASRPTLTGLEMHLITMLKEIARFEPHAVVLDPINSFVTDGNESDVKMMLLRLVDALKTRQITGFFTCLTEGGDPLEKTDVAISSLIDTWLLVRDIESGGERNRGLCVLKSRGMPHSNQVREFQLTGHGIELREAYTGTAGAQTGSARLADEAQVRALQLKLEHDVLRRQDALTLRRTAMEAQIAAVRAEFAAQEAAALGLIEQVRRADDTQSPDRAGSA